jgi:hypothetical protein
MNRHRPAIAQLVSMWGALPGSIRRFASDLASVVAEEGRHVPARLAWTSGALAFAGMLLLTGWLLLCVATASWIAAEYGWQRETALYMVALLNLFLGIIFVVAAYRWLKPPFFPVTAYEIQRLRTADTPLDTARAVGNSPPVSGIGPKERALMQSEAELQARISEVRRTTPQLLTAPSVIGATAGVGMLLGLVTSNKRKRQATSVPAYAANVPVSRQLLNVALVQLSSLALAVALRELQRRAGHDRQRR